jgi:hypothetical protein
MAGINLDVSGLKVLLEPVSAQTFSLTVPSAVPAVVEVLATGPQGPGVPRGGVEFDLLEKAGPDDFDTRFTSTPSVRGMSFSTTDAAELDAPGDLAWDDLDQALAYRTNGIMVDIAQENLIYVRNGAGAGCDYEGHGGLVCGGELRTVLMCVRVWRTLLGWGVRRLGWR